MSTSNYPLLSVIVPVYGTEKYLRKCLDSLLAETYPNMEIIVVNDASPDQAEEIIQEYTQQYDNIRCVKNEQNQGLFQARLRGYEAAKGEYICTVDSDDSVGVDYHRRMILKALETGADIVSGDVILCDTERKRYFLRTYGTYALEGIDLEGKEILSSYFRTEGETSHRYLGATKLYKKDLWDRCCSDLMMLNRHLIMLEDLAFGTVFMSRAKRYVVCDEPTYFYEKHPDSSSGINQAPAKLFRNLEDQVAVFEFLEHYLAGEGLLEENKRGFTLLRQKQARTWKSIVSNASLNSGAQRRAEMLLEQIGPGYQDTKGIDDSFFYRQHTPWDSRYEELKRAVICPDISYISFDIFDTLIVRPFLKPVDLFWLLNDKMDHLLGSVSMRTFSELRVEAERMARERAWQDHRYEDITLQEIYDELSTQYHIPEEIAQHLMREERELELRFCTARKKIKEIYELAVFLGKKVICVSDMYLDRDLLQAILKKNGYDQIDALFISNENRLSKASGHLFDEVIKHFKLRPEELLHIGDNWDSDILSAREKGINTFFVPRSAALFGNHIPDMRKKKCRAAFEAAFQRLPTGNMAKYHYETGYFGIRCMLGMVANKAFDHPFWSYEAGTDFNRSPYYVGYYALGMHVFSIVQWLIGLCQQKGYRKIHFVARDGYAAMKVYEIVSKYYPNSPQYDYFYMSRKSFLPLLVAKPEDLDVLPKFIPFKGKTPREFIGYLRPILSGTVDKDAYWKNGVILERPMENKEDYQKFVSALLKLSYSQEQNDRYRARMKEYFSSIIGENDVMFDIGYSGRAQAILSSLLGRGVNAAYIHYLDDQVYTYSDRFHFQVDCYFPYTPTIIGKLRETLQSDTIGSCIGYNIEGQTVTPVLEQSIHSFHARFVLDRIHQGACDFAREFMETFADYLPLMHIRAFEASFAHEYFLHYPTRGDMQMFSVVFFEDDVLNGRSYTQRISDVWWRDLKWYRLKGAGGNSGRIIGGDVDLNSAPAWKLTVYQAMFDRRSLKDRVKARLQKHPALRSVLKLGYKCLRKLYKGVKGIRSWRYRLPQRELPPAPAVKGLPTVGKKDGTGKILYIGTSDYGVLCCLLHKLAYHSEERCVLLLSEWRRSKAVAIEESGIFSEVHVFNDCAMRAVSTPMNTALEGAGEGAYNQCAKEFLAAYEDNFPFDLDSFEKIIVHNTAMPLGSYLEHKGISYEAFEDAAGIFSDSELLLQSIEKTYPLVEQWLISHYHVVGQGMHCDKWYINYSAQAKPFDHTKTEDFEPTAILERLPKDKREAVLQIFGVTPPAADAGREAEACLVLTYPMSKRLNVSEREQKVIYATLIDLFGEEGQPVYLKPHPDDSVDYKEFTGVHMIPPEVLSELLKYEVGAEFSCGISAVSTALNGMKGIRRKVYFDEGLVTNRTELLKYFVAGVLLKQMDRPDTEYIHLGACKTLLDNLLSEWNWNSAMCGASPENTVCFIGDGAGEVEAERAAGQYGTVISLQRFSESQAVRICKRKGSGSYMTDLEDEYIYIKCPYLARYRFRKQLKTLNIELIVGE